MTLVLGTPVGLRDWILPRWFDCIARQTVQPDALVFVHGGERGDATWRCLLDGARQLGVPVQMHYDGPHVHSRTDAARYATLAKLRDKCLSLANIMFAADLYLSLDSDILLLDPTTIEQLRDTVQAGWDVAAPVTWFHPLGAQSWAVNAFQFTSREDSPTCGIRRVESREFASYVTLAKLRDKCLSLANMGLDSDAAVMHVDFTAGVQMFGKRVLRDCRYRASSHESGEDVGFGRVLRKAGARVAWLPHLATRHVWEPAAL